MSSLNPYAAPNAENEKKPQVIPLLWSVMLVFGCGFLGALLGLAMGSLIGTIAPDYYRSVFANGNQPNFNPLAMGQSLGVMQGAGAGTVLGMILVGFYYWYRLKALRLLLDTDAIDD